MSQTAATFAISDLAREFGITPRTIRFWEDQGIVAPQRKAAGGSSRGATAPAEDGAARQRLGLSLAEIKDLIGMYASTGDKKPTQLLECLRVIDKRRAVLLQQREDIEAMLAEIAQFETLCRDELARRKQLIFAAPKLTLNVNVDRRLP